MTGVVLCGGQSTRMGTDKGLLEKGNLTWAEIAFRKLASLKIPVIVSVNKSQVDAYSKIFSSGELIVDDESIPVKGPLLGLLSAHKNYCKEDLLVLACDMIEINQVLLNNLVDAYNKAFFDVYVFVTGTKLQPLFGIYTSKGLKKIDDLMKQQQLEKFSMMHVLESLNTKCIEVAEPSFHLFNNYNSEEDLKK